MIIFFSMRHSKDTCEFNHSLSEEEEAAA